MLEGINHITLAVKKIDTSFSFYREILALRPLCKWEKGAYFLVGDLWLCLNVDEKREPQDCYTHYAFTVQEGSFDRISQNLLSQGVKVFKENTSPGKSLYFLDPDGHKLEIHAGSWKSRMESKKKDPGLWTQVEWFC